MAKAMVSDIREQTLFEIVRLGEISFDLKITVKKGYYMQVHHIFYLFYDYNMYMYIIYYLLQTLN